ncbi:MAG: NAD(P)H-dependent oxidoreductase [Nitrospiraceae bacterium]
MRRRFGINTECASSRRAGPVGDAVRGGVLKSLIAVLGGCLLAAGLSVPNSGADTSVPPVLAAASSPSDSVACPIDKPITVLIAYHSGSGNTAQLAKGVAEGVESVAGTRVVLRRVEQVTADELFGADALILGSPVYWSNMAGEVKTFIDNWQFKFGVWPELKLKNKVGAAFATGGQQAGGKELTMLSILAAMLHNQMVVVAGGGAFGASATTEGDSPGIDKQELASARDLGRRVVDVASIVRRGAPRSNSALTPIQ